MGGFIAHCSPAFKIRPFNRRKSYLIVTARVVITVVDADLTAIDASVGSDAEVVGHERATVRLQDDVALEEGALGNARVDLLGLRDHNGLVLKVEEDGHFPDAVVLETALNNMLLEVALEAEDLSKSN